MVKGAMQSMRGAQEFLAKANIAKIGGWVAAGASKRGWTTWMVGAVTCPTCPNIVAIAPLVPIVPNLRAEIHRMWQAYHGERPCSILHGKGASAVARGLCNRRRNILSHPRTVAFAGFTFAFVDYTAINLTTHVDSPIFEKMLQVLHHDSLRGPRVPPHAPRTSTCTPSPVVDTAPVSLSDH